MCVRKYRKRKKGIKVCAIADRFVFPLVKLLHRDGLITPNWLRVLLHAFFLFLFFSLTTGGSQPLMRHFISKSAIMAELHQPLHEPKSQLLSIDDLNEEKEGAGEAAKKKRRKKKRNRNSAPGEIRAFPA